MNQETLHIDLSESLKEFVLQQVSEGVSSSPSEYIARLIHADRRRKALEQYEPQIIEALESGEPEEVTPELWEQLKQRVREREARKAASP